MTRIKFDWSANPECSLGYSEAQFRELLRDGFPVIAEYMLMKATPVCSGPRGTDQSGGPKSSCATAHDNVFYLHDVLRFVEEA